MDFIFRLYKDEINNIVLSNFDSITISGITVISKPSKFEDVCFHKGNQKKFKYNIRTSIPFNKVSGSHSTPTLTFKGNYIDIIIENFPRYPSFYQSSSAANSCLNGYGYTNYINKGFPVWENYRKYEFKSK